MSPSSSSDYPCCFRSAKFNFQSCRGPSTDFCHAVASSRCYCPSLALNSSQPSSMSSSYCSSKPLASMASIATACCRLARQAHLAAPRNETEIFDIGFSFGRPGCMDPVHLEKHPPSLVDRYCFCCLSYLARVACTRHSNHNEQIAHVAEASDSWRRYQTDSTTLRQLQGAWRTCQQESHDSAAEFLFQLRSPAGFALSCCRR